MDFLAVLAVASFIFLVSGLGTFFFCMAYDIWKDSA